MGEFCGCNIYGWGKNWKPKATKSQSKNGPFSQQLLHVTAKPFASGDFYPPSLRTACVVNLERLN